MTNNMTGVTRSIPAGTITGGGYWVRVISSNYTLTVEDNESGLVITDVTGIDNTIYEKSSVYFSGNNLVVDRQNTSFVHPQI